MSIYDDLDSEIAKNRTERDLHKEGSWLWTFATIQITALQNLRKKSLGRCLPNKDSDSMLSMVIKPKLFELEILNREVKE